MTSYREKFYKKVRESIANNGQSLRFIYDGVPTLMDNQSGLHDARVLHLIQNIRAKYNLPAYPILVRPNAYTLPSINTLADALTIASTNRNIVLTQINSNSDTLIPVSPKDDHETLSQISLNDQGTYTLPRWNAAIQELDLMETRETELSKIHNAWRRARPNHWTPFVTDMVFNLSALDDDNRVTLEEGFITFPKNGMGAQVFRHFDHNKFKGQTYVTTRYTIYPFYIVDGKPMRIEFTPHPKLEGQFPNAQGYYELNSPTAANTLLSALWNAPRHSAAPPADNILTNDQSSYRIKRDRIRTKRPKEQLTLDF